MNSYRIKLDRWARGLQPEAYFPIVWQPFRLRVFLSDGAFQFGFGFSTLKSQRA